MFRHRLARSSRNALAEMISLCARSLGAACKTSSALSKASTAAVVGLNASVLTNAAAVAQRATIYDDAYLKLDDFTKSAASMRDKYMFSITKVRNDLNKSLENVVRSETRKDDRTSDQTNLRKLFYLATDSDDDYRLMINIIKSNLKSKTFTQNEIRSFVIILMRAIYANNKLDIGLSLFEDEDLKSYVLGSYPALFMLNKLAALGRHVDLLKYFEMQIPHFSTSSFSIETPVVFRQPWPIDQIELAVEALFKLNNREALEKLKNYVETCVANQSTFSKHSIVRAFLLAIRQNDPELALRIARNFVYPIDLKINLEIIALARLKRLNDAFSMAREIFSVRFETNQMFVGRIYPLTIRSLKEAVEMSTDSLQYMKHFDDFWQRVQREGRLLEFDLDVYVDRERYKAQSRYEVKFKFKNLKSKLNKVNKSSSSNSSAARTPA